MTDLERFLREDLGPRGDVTTRLLFGARPIPARARVWARERLVVAGLTEAARVFRRFRCRTRARAREGAWVRPGGTLLEVQGSLQAILAAERLALNLIGRLSGVATATRHVVDRVRRVNLRCRVAATRKTTPGLRAMEKRAVIAGGGQPHRMGLYDGILIKDNHLAAAQSLADAVARARTNRWRLPVEVEASTARDVEAAARAGADWILLDNLGPQRARALARLARRIRPRTRIEVSGGLGEANVGRYAAFADRVSLGSLTHSAPSRDVTLDLWLPKH